ncbi:MAG: N-acetylneuraminate synthase [Acidimicrobiaceae bacterium]|nr:N-acetylneuraminate synthase [Acidimicrobiaceae bacterium]
MTNAVDLGFCKVGDGHPVLVIAEIGINHNGDLDLCRQIMAAATEAGCGAVKFQKRTIDLVYSAEELDRPRDSPFGSTNRDLKSGLEFGDDAYDQIAELCTSLGVAWTASCWDENSVAFIERYEPPFYKIASASLTDDNLLRRHRETGRPLVLSTGMSSLAQIDHAVEILGNESLILMQCTSAYPTIPDELNLRVIDTLKKRYGVPVGFSAHDQSLAASVAAVALGACIIERHVTIDRSMWGSDQAASLEPKELTELIHDVRLVERSLGDGIKRVYESEISVCNKLRRIG